MGDMRGKNLKIKSLDTEALLMVTFFKVDLSDL